MMAEQLLLLLCSLILSSAIILISAFIFYRYIFIDYKILSASSKLDELLLALNLIINTELEIYEKNIFNTKGSLTNSNFENYYNDITRNIVNHISKNFWKHIQFYMTEEAIVEVVCRTVRQWLVDKVYDIDNESDEEDE